jgi:alpha-galactosidase
LIPAQVALYHRYNDLIRAGDYYRLASYAENRYYDCWGVVSKDKEEALFTFIQVLSRPNQRSLCLKLKGLNPDYDYQVTEDSRIFSGEALLQAGILILPLPGDFQGRLIHLRRVEL